MPPKISPARPDSPDAIALIAELESELVPLYPDESRHGYSVEKLLRENVAFFIIHHNGRAAGCGGIQLFPPDYGELKRMFIRPTLRGLGLGKLMLQHLESHARQNGLPLVRLETGIHQRQAIALYEHMGYHRIGPFGPYRNDPLSVFMEKHLA
jgi:putative acetyltransferase